MRASAVPPDDGDDDDEASTFHAVLLPQPLLSSPEFALFTLFHFSGSFLHISAHY